MLPPPHGPAWPPPRQWGHPAHPHALPQVILCFSPVGSTLRVRARRFPAVVNCTAIDWFHEWPEDALVSVSSRFLEETGDIEVSWDPGSVHAAPVRSPLTRGNWGNWAAAGNDLRRRCSPCCNTARMGPG